MKRCAALICLLCCLLGGALAEKQEWTGAEWARLKEALASDKVNPVPEGHRMAAPKLSAGEKDFANVLLLSTDAPEGEKNFGRADAILVCRVDLTTGDMHLVSLPEDALAEVDGLPQAVALRYVNCFGGPALVASVVNKALGLSVNRYCAVSEEAFERAVDTLGGVSMELTAGEGQALGLSEGRHYPNEAFWKIAAEEGNDVILGFDAHRPEHLQNRAVEEQARNMAKRLGLKLIEKPVIREL